MKLVGVIGGGQLAWMMGDAAKKLGLELVVQTPSKNDPAVSVAQETVFAAVDDADATNVLATKCDVITFENEFVNLDALSVLEDQGVCFRPRLTALAPLLDKYHQRCYLRDLGLPVPNFFALDQQEDIKSKIEHLGFPVVLKSRRHGYDGQGTFIIHDLANLQSKLDLNTINQKLSQQLFLLEEFVPFERELAVIAARSVTGEVVIYPVVETQQEQQVCRRVIAPADITPDLADAIEAIAHTLLNNLQVVGVFGIELFLTADGKVLVNEIAPRTHNSGHFSLDACETSQFEQHLRAVSGLPLGNPALQCAGAVMVNLLGYENSHSDYHSQRQQLAEIPHAHVHWYSKTESRPGRKLGHVTVLLEQQNQDTANAYANGVGAAISQTIESIWYPG
ncbi:5-(carboxyamino)imidazole ribonucleotide synthase [Cylindrospermum stagnale PCC 7417]|uniref:N5-carboxyaminoimidazole ribonucleotide synthase n=1 Tax=Cylindrospermum stagnale PCC 7417 TaxID=56107 RepID=K9X5L8_9NOST|nr:5-(carboxyamino)imidazole ribonucleotide synthase [Cylindrospermum stagnale]AFZ27950.1 5-(carboxyamino)imidazole ribonucleotide synthase [Cylindrospermum stagnale PCC 7417]